MLMLSLEKTQSSKTRQCGEVSWSVDTAKKRIKSRFIKDCNTLARSQWRHDSADHAIWHRKISDKVMSGRDGGSIAAQAGCHGRSWVKWLVGLSTPQKTALRTVFVNLFINQGAFDAEACISAPSTPWQGSIKARLAGTPIAWMFPAQGESPMVGVPSER